MKATNSRLARAEKKRTEVARRTPAPVVHPVHDLNLLTPAQQKRFNEIWDKATNYSPNMQPAWSILTDDEVIEMSDLYAASEVKR